MNPPASLETPVDPHDAPPPITHYPPTPLSWRVAIGVAILVVFAIAFALKDSITYRGQGVAGVIFFFGIVAMFSSNLRAVNWRTIFWGIALQAVLAVLVLYVPPVKHMIEGVGWLVKQLLGFVYEGSKFVFGNLWDPRKPADGGTYSKVFGVDWAFQFAFVALPPILFFSALFTVFYHFGVLQRLVKMLAKVMLYLMGTSGAETLSVAANVFMGQTEAPLIVRPYVPRMTNSELFALMTSGFAHISGGLMAVYISYGADPVAVITTCVMACPCSLYLAKLFVPEISKPVTGGKSDMKMEKSPYVNTVDAAASGTSDGLSLAMNVAAMLIVFIAFVAMFDAILSSIGPILVWAHVLRPENVPEWLATLKLGSLFGWVFSPVAFLMGVAWEDAKQVGSLLGTKLSINEHVAYLQMQQILPIKDAAGAAIPMIGHLSVRSAHLAAFALTGFANFSSVGIQLGGIGGMAPSRRHDLARLGMRALFVGFTATLLNASIAGILLPNVVVDKPDDKQVQSSSEKTPAATEPGASVPSGTNLPADAKMPANTPTPDAKSTSEPTQPAASGDGKSSPAGTPDSKSGSALPIRRQNLSELVDFKPPPWQSDQFAESPNLSSGKMVFDKREITRLTESGYVI
ncbi:MAG TPA: nucleoside transporter C-terminal domain-containing protein [Pirellulales bacterium]|jgi:CNT family concentrative nucleoside transporter